jgi:putative FmdB family regulatory protein
MPRFDFFCQTYGLVFEADQPLQPSAARVTCPHGHREVRKRFSPPVVIFKGSGWYITDSRKPDSPRTPAD